MLSFVFISGKAGLLALLPTFSVPDDVTHELFFMIFFFMSFFLKTFDMILCLGVGRVQPQ
jgi:hypothetical protein